MYRPTYRVILDTIQQYIDWYLILSTDLSTNVLADTLNNTRAFIDQSSVDQCINRYMNQSTNTLGEGIVSVRYRTGAVSVQYRWSISEVSVNHQVYWPIGAWVDTLVDAWPIYRPILDRVSTDTWSTIDPYSIKYWPTYRLMHRSQPPIRYMILDELLICFFGKCIEVFTC